jgi:hypothetical protein
MKHEYHEGPKAGENFESLAADSPRITVSETVPRSSQLYRHERIFG